MLFLIPTPIGNLKDITYRAVEILRSVDFVLCEDTRRTKKLLNHFGITTPVKRYNEHDTASVGGVLKLLKDGKKIALVSDSGTPCISDPGRKIVVLARAAGIDVVSVPGPSAVTAALAGSGFGSGGFVFLGFMPRSRSKIISLVSKSLEFAKPVIIFESPHRVVKLLKLLTENFGSDTPAVLARELTKVYEEWICESLGKLYEKLASRKKILGEIVLILNPATVSVKDKK